MFTSRYLHTNIAAVDWQKLSRFYEDVFGCQPVPPERHLTGPWVCDGTGLRNAEIHGQHLRLPGCGEDGPTLEIFEYLPKLDHPSTQINRPGFGHIAFLVDDIGEAQRAVLAAGGGKVGKAVALTIGNVQIEFIYLYDPEGNVIELQRRSLIED